MAGLVLDRHRPTLREVAGRWPRPLRIGIAALAAAVVAAIVATSVRDARRER